MTLGARTAAVPQLYQQYRDDYRSLNAYLRHNFNGHDLDTWAAAQRQMVNGNATYEIRPEDLMSPQKAMMT